MIITSRSAPNLCAVNTILAKRGSTGNRLSSRPDCVKAVLLSRLADFTACNSSSSVKPSLIFLLSGACTNGNCAISPKPKASICKITEAKFVRRISGSVNSGRDKKSSSEYKRIQIPASTRPQRPIR